ncbi:MAG: hypothetical protein SGPRY_008335, partial [Prymnesium sp.]
MRPRPRGQADAAPNRTLDAARSGLQHLQEQERMLTSKCLPMENPVEAAFKAPEPLPHSYLPRSSAVRTTGGAPVPLRVPKALHAIGGAPLNGSGAHGELHPSGAISYAKVRRWEMLPKHAWLQAAESGHAPGPGFRDVSGAQTLRSFAPMKTEADAPAEEPAEEPVESVAPKPETKLGLSASIGQNYSPTTRGLVPTTLMAMLKDGLPPPPEQHKEEAEESGEELNKSIATFSLEPAVDAGAEVASSFLPLAFFDSEDMESLSDTPWESIAERYAAGNPLMARSRYHSAEGKLSLLECEVVRYIAEEAKFEIQWLHNGRRKLVSRCAYETVDGNTLTTSDAILNEVQMKHRLVGTDEARWQGKAAQRSLAELRTEYAAAMKLATLNYEMLSNEFRNKIRPLKLPRPKVKEIPEKGCVVIPEAKAKEARKRMQENLFFADAALLACIRMVFDESFWMRETLLLSTQLDMLEAPSSLENFLTIQVTSPPTHHNPINASTLETIRLKLLTNWIPVVETTVQHDLGQLPESEQVQEARISRFLKQVGLLMQDELQLMVLESMRSYLELLNLFAMPLAQTQRQPEEWVHALPRAEPALIWITLKLDRGALVVEKLREVLEAFVEQTENIPMIRQKGARASEHVLKTLKKDDLQLLKARQSLDTLLETALARPKQLLELFENFSELAQVVEEEYLGEIASEKWTLNQYSDDIAKWNKMADEVMAITPPEARALATGVAMLVVTELEERTSCIGESYKLIYERLQTQSATAEEVVEMNAYLQSCEMELTDLQIGIDNDIIGRLGLLDSFMANLPDEVFSMVYDTLGWPARVQKVAADATTKQEEDRQFFMEQLRTDREKFADELDEWDVDIKALSSLGGGDNPMADVEPNAAT